MPTAYHPQTNGQAELANRKIKHTLEKTINLNQNDWSFMIDRCLMGLLHDLQDHLRHVPLSVCLRQDLPFFDWDGAPGLLGDQKFEFLLPRGRYLKKAPTLKTYENSCIYKEMVKAFHDKNILLKNLKPNQKVLMYNSRLHLFLNKLRFRWLGPYMVKIVFLHGAIEIKKPLNDNIFKVNSQRLKPFLESFDGEEAVKDLVDPIHRDPPWIPFVLS